MRRNASGQRIPIVSPRYSALVGTKKSEMSKEEEGRKEGRKEVRKREA